MRGICHEPTLHDPIRDWCLDDRHSSGGLRRGNRHSWLSARRWWGQADPTKSELASRRNTVFIQNPQTGYVMELQSQSTVACPLVVNPRRISNESYQLWTAVDQTGGAVALPVVSLAPPGFTLKGSSQYALLPPNQGDHLVGITITLDIIEDVVVDGCSIQVNCNTPYLGPDG